MTEKERFWSKVKIAAPDECWEWQDFCDKFGYGHFRTKVRMIRSHRYSLQLSVGRTLEPHECACHKCNNTSCVNPNHLYVGSQKENMQDMANAKTVRGENHYKPDDVVKELAKRFQEFQETPATRLLKSSKSAAEGIMNTMDSYAEQELDIDTAKKLSAILKDVSGIIKSLDMAMK